MFAPIPPTRWQQQAIDYSVGNLLILACAGSGKTETLACRIAKMVKEGAPRSSISGRSFPTNRCRATCMWVLRERDPQYRRYLVMDDLRQPALITTNFVRFENTGMGPDRLCRRTRSKTYGEACRTFLNTLNMIYQQKKVPDGLGDEALHGFECRQERLP